MAIRFYLVPVTGDGSSPTNARQPKYFAAAGIPWLAMDYGLEPVMLVGADVTAGQHAALIANADVVAAPANLDGTLSAPAANAADAALEGFNIPGDWIVAGMTWRGVLRWTARLFLIAQRLHGQANARLFDVAANLDVTVGSLPVGRRQALATAAQSLGIDTSGVTGAMTLRQALRSLADQLTISVPWLEGA